MNSETAKAGTQKMSALMELSAVLTAQGIEGSETMMKYYWDSAYRERTAYWNKIKEFQVVLDGKEWRKVDFWDNLRKFGSYRECELCGFPNCRWVYKIAPEAAILLSETDAEAKGKIIGDECIWNYTKDMDEYTKERMKKQSQKMFRTEEKLDRTKVALQVEAFLRDKSLPYSKAFYAWGCVSKIKAGSITMKEIQGLKMLLQARFTEGQKTAYGYGRKHINPDDWNAILQTFGEGISKPKTTADAALAAGVITYADADIERQPSKPLLTMSQPSMGHMQWTYETGWRRVE
jgi:hypothetical protein